ncbi:MULTISPECIES: helix-turn-helix transcriptional regulator [unclassified Dehalobacter]|uniref:helix-turn-helix transcriptional regulator n=1 Tax=unclassified Dehalobacter TaxID=2635733 RepID=UPI000E6CDA41|nr:MULTISPECIES: helix-turn-helix transcriptional regulator [unclassified Dehalobacter]RJE46653.1 transcriptional regulator [Dehalobacter sp. MCB1]TCX47419.1 XRE family transcriptional regulator [Dehalobacter sp. 14DCB1]TCX55632.1 XRE family transcriptional regulator [Dehalobacter sp. 12DCB1]
MILDGKELGAAIKAARIDNKLTQEKLAEMINVASVHIKQVEAGSRKPSVDLLFKIAITLNMSVDTVFFPERLDGQELLQKIIRKLNICSLHQLHVVYTTVNAMTENPENLV